MIIHYANELKESLEKKLSKIKNESLDIRSQCLTAIPIIRDSLMNLKIYMQGYSFADGREEIHFHKKVAPAFHAEYIYHVKTLNIETRMPGNEPESRKSYIQDHIKWINRFFDQNKSMYQYYKVDATAFDDTFFMRYPQQSDLEYEEVCAVIDTNFCTLYSYKLAQFMGYEKVLDHLAGCMMRNGHLYPDSDEPVTWTGKKVFLVELLFLLFYSRCINNGNVTLRTLANILENAFHTKLDNFSRIKQEILNRKNLTAFIDFCREAYLNGITENL